jgi:hypothetical protein
LPPPCPEHRSTLQLVADWGVRPRPGCQRSDLLVDADHLTITAYNIHHEGEEAKAVEIKYERVR